MRKTKGVKGKALKNTYDSLLAKSHKKGAPVQVVQPAKDNKWGRYYFTRYFRFPVILNEADAHYETTISLLNRCRQEPLGKDCARFVPEELKEELEVASMKFLILFKLGFEYLTMELLDSIYTIKANSEDQEKTSWEDEELVPRINILKNELGYKIDTPGCLTLLFDRRDIVEHPSSSRIYNSDKNSWKSVHLAWVLNGEIETTNGDIQTFVDGLIEAYEMFRETHKRPGTLNVKRGLRSDDPYRK